jgi:hypothetical protein
MSGTVEGTREVRSRVPKQLITDHRSTSLTAEAAASDEALAWVLIWVLVSQSVWVWHSLWQLQLQLQLPLPLELHLG